VDWGLFQVGFLGVDFTPMKRLPVQTTFAATLIVILSLVSARAEQTQICERHSYRVADGYRLTCSATWKFEATCNGLDMWNRWSITGRTNPADFFVRPWLPTPISIVGYELVKLPGNSWSWWFKSWFSKDAWTGWFRSWFVDPQDTWFMVGSTIVPDGMTWLAPGESHAKTIWPSGHGQLWPSAATAAPTKPIKDANGKDIAFAGDLIDLHGACFAGRVAIFLTIYYTPAFNASAPTASAETAGGQ